MLMISKGHFQTTSEPARLIVEPVKVEDQGVYRYVGLNFRNNIILFR